MIVKMYLHSSKENNFAVAEEYGLTPEQISVFKYALHEVEFEVEVDSEGYVEILKVAGKELKQ